MDSIKNNSIKKNTIKNKENNSITKTNSKTREGPLEVSMIGETSF